MAIKEHFTKMLITVGWFGTGALIISSSVFLYNLLSG
jgi:hypothetical protein